MKLIFLLKEFYERYRQYKITQLNMVKLYLLTCKKNSMAEYNLNFDPGLQSFGGKLSPAC